MHQQFVVTVGVRGGGMYVSVSVDVCVCDVNCLKF